MNFVDSLRGSSGSSKRGKGNLKRSRSSNNKTTASTQQNKNTKQDKALLISAWNSKLKQRIPAIDWTNVGKLHDNRSTLILWKRWFVRRRFINLFLCSWFLAWRFHMGLHKMRAQTTIHFNGDKFYFRLLSSSSRQTYTTVHSIATFISSVVSYRRCLRFNIGFYSFQCIERKQCFSSKKLNNGMVKSTWFFNHCCICCHVFRCRNTTR